MPSLRLILIMVNGIIMIIRSDQRLKEYLILIYMMNIYKTVKLD